MTEIRTPEELDAPAEGEAREALVMGIAQSATGELIDLGDFTQYVADDREALVIGHDAMYEAIEDSPNLDEQAKSEVLTLVDHLAARQPAPVDAGLRARIEALAAEGEAWGLGVAVDLSRRLREALAETAPVDEETTTEWGIRHELAGIDVEDDDGKPFTEEMAREYIEDYHGAVLVSRQITPWREVRHDG